jgi:hypothetical protein
MTATKEQMILSDAIEQHGYDDWYCAILHATIETTKDAAKAIALADQIFEQHPKDKSKPQDNDADVLFAGAKNA